MTLSNGTSKTGKVYNYYKCSLTMKKGQSGCKGMRISMGTLDSLVSDHLCQRLLIPERITELVSAFADTRTKRTKEVDGRLGSLKKDAAEAEEKLKRLYDGIEWGIIELDELLKERVEKLTEDRRRTMTALDRASAHLIVRDEISQDMIREFISTMREYITTGDIPLRKAYIRSTVQSVVVDDHDIRRIGANSSIEKAIRSKKRSSLGS
jgi:site-specific DNA recombinase